MYKPGVIAFALTCILLFLSGCDNSPQAQQNRALKVQARNELFIKCVEIATRANVGPYRDNAEIVQECRVSAQQLI